MRSISLCKMDSGRRLMLKLPAGAAAHTAVLVASILAVLLGTASGQQVTQFLPSGLAAISGGVTARLVYRMDGFADNFKDPTVRAVYLADRVVLEPVFWRSRFADTGGVAPIGPNRPAGSNFTVTSGNTSSETSRPELNFSGMPNAILMDKGGFMVFNNVLVSDIASSNSYDYTPNQPWVNQGIGYALWPTLALAPQAMVYLYNVSVAYVNPSSLDTCEQYNRKALFGLQQAYGDDNVTLVNATAGNVAGPVNIPVLVLNGSTNASVGNATAVYQNVTFNCLPKRPDTPGAARSGLSPGALVAAIVAPIVGALAICLLAGCCIRDRNLRRRAAALEAERRNKDVEAGLVQLQSQRSVDTGDTRDQHDPRQPSRRRASGGSNNTPSNVNSSASTIRNFLAIPPETPLMEGIIGTRSIHSTGGSSSNSMKQMCNSMHGMPTSYGATGSSGASTLSPVGSMPLAMVHSSSQGQTASAQSHLGTDSTSLGPLNTGATYGNSSDGPSASNRSSGGAGSSGGQPTVAERYAGISSLLKARSEIAVLRELKIGSLLGRGSYVAVKVIEHVEGAPGTASSGGKRISVGRESLLATSISHPNVVQTFHISTMRVSERSALANTWLTDVSGNAAGNMGGPKDTNTQQQHAADDHSSDDNNSQGSMEAQKDLLETWMIMEFCEKGSLERSVNQGRFIRRSDKQPEMVGIYKALLDTASGLDYLHSMGVVHGDLKTANVLLKGSAKDPRGFMCKITDFGLSRVLDLDATHISTATYGTIVYMPKELLLSGRMTQATDIYSFGLMMWELLTSSRVFDEGMSIGQMFYLIAYQNWRPQIPENCPPGYAELMTACWHEDPNERPSAPELLKRLQKLYVRAKQELAANRTAELAVAGAGAAAAANMLGGTATGSADSAGPAESGHTAAAAEPPSTAAAAAASGMSSRTRLPLPAATPFVTSTFPGSDASMTSSTAGPVASDGQGEGSEGSALILGSGGSALGKEISSGGDGEGEDYQPYAAGVLQRKRSGSLATGSASGTVRSSADRQHLQQLQQQRQSGSFTTAAIGVRSPRPGMNSDGTLPGSSDIEVYDDPIASESLLQTFTSNSNAQEGGDLMPDYDQEFSGYLAEDGSGDKEAGGQHGQQKGPSGGAFNSLEMSARPRGYGAPSSLGAAAVQDSASLTGGVSGFSPSGTDSFSTGTMPSVVADSWIGSQSSRSLFGGSFFGVSQASGRLTSSMTLGSMPPSPSHASGGTSTAAAGQPTAASSGGSAAPAPGQSLVSAFQAASGLAPASPANRSYGALQTVQEVSAQQEGAGASPPGSQSDTATDIRVALAQRAAGATPAAAHPPASPFAALAQRAGSLFGPVKP